MAFKTFENIVKIEKTLNDIILAKRLTPVTNLELRETLDTDFERIIVLLQALETRLHNENPHQRKRNRSENLANKFRRIR